MIILQSGNESEKTNDDIFMRKNYDIIYNIEAKQRRSNMLMTKKKEEKKLTLIEEKKAYHVNDSIIQACVREEYLSAINKTKAASSTCFPGHVVRRRNYQYSETFAQ